MIVFVLLLNPLLWNIGASLRLYYPDTVSYVMAAQAIRSEMLFFVVHGHVDLALVLPPVYPTIIAAASKLIDGWLPAAEMVSRVSLLLAMPVLYWLVSGVASRLTTVTALIVLQLMGYYFELGMLPLTEATICLRL